MTHNSFYQAMYQANLLYGVSFNNEDDFAEIALNAWSIIGNKNVRLYKYITHTNCEDLSVTLPCNCDIIEAVTACGEDWEYTSDTRNDDNLSAQWTEEYIETRKTRTHPLYQSGHYVHYNRIGNKLYFDKNYGTISILYKGIELDENDLPYLNDKEVNAIATYVAWIVNFKEAILTSNSSKLQIAQMLQLRWNIQCDLARTPEEVSQNDMNEIADAKSSWGRKLYGKSLKPLLK